MKQQTTTATGGFQKLSSLVLAFVIAITTVFASAEPAAALEIEHTETKKGTASAGVEIKIPFKVEYACDVGILLNISKPTDTTIAVYDAAGKSVNSAGENPKKIPAEEFVDMSLAGVASYTGYAYADNHVFSLPEGYYQLGLTFADSVTYQLDYTVVELMTNIQMPVFLDVGSTKQMSEMLADSEKKLVSSWTSSDGEVAFVDQNGLVTAKKRGTATITAWTADKKAVFECLATVDILGESEVTTEPETVQLQIVEGFAQKLSAGNEKIKSWSSSNKKVATVDGKKGIIARKKGEAVISVELEDGRKLKYEVTVIKNVYISEKISKKKVNKGEVLLDLYKMSYDKKGNLVLKVQCISRLSHKLPKLLNLKIVIKDREGNTVGTYQKSNMKINLNPDSSKDLTFVIKKSKLKKKKVELPFAESEVTAYYYD